MFAPAGPLRSILAGAAMAFSSVFVVSTSLGLHLFAAHAHDEPAGLSVAVAVAVRRS